MQPSISVLMPVYNAAATLNRSIESILNQSFTDFEFIIVNDYGSEDGSREIIQEYCKRDNRIRLIQLKKREGIAGSLNIGILFANGKYIARMDADDYSYPNRLKVEWDYMESHPECVLCGSAIRIITSSGSYISKVECDPQEIRAELLFSGVFYHPTVIFQRHYFIKHGYFYRKEIICEDLDLWTRIEAVCGNVPDVLLDYYHDHDNASTTNFDTMMKGTFLVIEEQLRRRLGIKPGTYHKRWLFPYQYDKELLNIKEIVEGFRFLRAIEQKNHVAKYCCESSLARLLMNLWNTYMFRLFFYYEDGVEQGLPYLDFNPSQAFSERLAEKLHTDISDIENELRQRWGGTIQAIKRIAPKQCIVFGVGRAMKTYFQNHPEHLEMVSCFCDNNPQNQGKTIMGRVVIAPKYLSNYSYDLIVISTFRFFDELRQQLVGECMVKPDKIVSIGAFKYF